MQALKCKVTLIRIKDMRNVIKFLSIIVVFALATCVACRSPKDSEATNNIQQTNEGINTEETNNIQQTSEGINIEEVYTVLDVRESAYSNGSAAYVILFVLQDSYGNRLYFEYSNDKIWQKDDTDVYNSLRIIIPGDKVRYLGENSFEILLEQ